MIARSHVAKLSAMFGLESARDTRQPRDRRRVEVLPGRVTLITGDSGAGKSTLLRNTAARLRAAGWRVIDVADIPLDPARAVVDCFGDLPLRRVLEILSRAGLAEAAALTRPAATLSDGQVFRFRLARALAAAADESGVSPAGGPVAILCDEFAAVLDRVTARVVAFGLRKMLQGTLVAAVVATAHDDLESDLRPIRVTRVCDRSEAIARAKDLRTTQAALAATCHERPRSCTPRRVSKTRRGVSNPATTRTAHDPERSLSG